VVDADELKRLLADYGIESRSEKSIKLLIYNELLGKWNSRINLSGAANWPSLSLFFQEGMWSSNFYPHDAFSHLDIGSGAGFPALLIRILVPKISMDLVESRAKRAAFLETVVSELNLSKTHIHYARLDEFLRKSEKIWDCVTWKGLRLTSRDLLQLCNHSHPKTQFWMFHGKSMSVEEPAILNRRFRLLGSKRFPPKREWKLSIFIPK
jgi:16S rRNA (guanine(527)-N(7))-methyltransferase RsmG